MKEYNEQVVETLDDAGCIIANKNIIIDNLQAKVAELEEEILIERSNGDHWRDAYSKWVNTDESARRLIELQEQLAKAEQRVAEACALQVATETKFHWLDSARVAKEIRSGEWRKFVKEV